MTDTNPSPPPHRDGDPAMASLMDRLAADDAARAPEGFEARLRRSVRDAQEAGATPLRLVEHQAAAERSQRAPGRRQRWLAPLALAAMVALTAALSLLVARPAAVPGDSAINLTALEAELEAELDGWTRSLDAWTGVGSETELDILAVDTLAIESDWLGVSAGDAFPSVSIDLEAGESL